MAAEVTASISNGNSSSVQRELTKEQMNNLEKDVGLTLVTGGAGFIGSHIVDKLLAHDIQVKVVDNLSSGDILNLSRFIDDKRLHFINEDLNNFESLREHLMNVATVFHMAAYPEVRTGLTNPEIPYNQNIRNTFYLLEEIRKSNVRTLLFGSTSTVYGEPEKIPTPEEYGPLMPISPYGASKLACEALVSSYCHTYGICGQIFRLANVIGTRSKHGVIWDFIQKLKLNNKRLEVLGDGQQSKSYIHISDCIRCIFFCLPKSSKRIEVFNVGNQDKIDTLSIARIVCNAMNLADAEVVTTGGVDNGRGWIGDVKYMQLDVAKLDKLGWSPDLSSASAVRLASEEILKEIL